MTASAKIGSATVLRRAPGVAYSNLAEGRGGVLLQVATGAYYGVDAVGALVWRLLEGSPTFGRLLSSLRGELENVPVTFEAEIAQLLAGLRDRGLIEAEGADPS